MRKIVLTYGTFDMLHHGHVSLLKRAKSLGDYLIVGLSTDEFNLIKGKSSYFNYDERKFILESIKYVDKVIPEKDWSQKGQDVIDYGVDIFTIGDDWIGKFDYLSEFCDVIYLSRTPDISTTKIKKDTAIVGIKK